MKTYIIYRHINKVNGKSYIGQTCQKLSARWKSGAGYTKEHQPAFYHAIQKYGWDSFTHEMKILENSLYIVYQTETDKEQNITHTLTLKWEKIN